VFVLAVEEFWPEPVAVKPEDEDDVDEVELAAVDVELVAEEPVPTDFVPPAPNPPEALRLPRKRGAISAANFSAVTIPVTRIVRSRSPAAMVAVRNAVISGFAAPVCCRTIHAPPATTTIASAIRSQRQRCRGLTGSGRRSSGAVVGFTGAAVRGRVLGVGALLILEGHHLLKRAPFLKGQYRG
jgi:hypothetical protein